MAFFREARSIDEVANELLHIILPINEPPLPTPPTIEPEVFADEVCYLLAFTVECATYSYLREGTLSGGFLDFFFDLLARSLPTKTDNPHAWEHLLDRLDTYNEIANTPHQEDLPTAIGQAFAHYCRRETDDNLIAFAAGLFDSSFHHAQDILRKGPIHGPVIL